MTVLRRGAFLTLTGTALIVLSCGTDGATPRGVHVVGLDRKANAPPVLLVESQSARARLAELRARFALQRYELHIEGAPHAERTTTPLRVPALRAAVATGFEAAPSPHATTHFRALIPASALRKIARPALVELPAHADGEWHLEDAAARVSVRFRMLDAKPSAAAVADGYALYSGAIDGADVVHRVHGEGTEDYVVFETRPAREELRYEIDVSRVPGLRLVDNTLEFLDDHGLPALRVAPPYVIDARSMQHGAKLAVTGCAYETSNSLPLGRPLTPGAKGCTLHVTWSDVAYPLMVDPAWSATGSLAVGRRFHTATVLPSGRVLIAGGFNGAGGPSPTALASAELFDPAYGGRGAFTATSSMTTARQFHTACALPSGKVLIVGGSAVSDEQGYRLPLASAELFDPAANGGAGAFVSTGSMAAPRMGHTASVLPSGKVLVAGGTDSGVGGSTPLASAELFDPAANGGVGTFTATGSMATARVEHTASVLASGKVLVAGGSDGSAELFDPAANGGTGAFAATGAMVTGRRGHTASVLASGKVLVTGGYNGGPYLDSAELFDPAANGGVGTFAATGSMVTARRQHTASLLASGQVLIGGGLGRSTVSVASGELFDPIANGGAGAFAAAGSMLTPRFDHTANVLLSGKVLITGGTDGIGAGAYLANAEVFGAALGDRCTGDGQCISGYCADGFCACGPCSLLDNDGTCTIVPSGNPGTNPGCAFPFACDGVSARCPTSCESDAACAPAYYCTPNGICLVGKGQDAACNMLTECKKPWCRVCANGDCVDGFCSASCTKDTDCATGNCDVTTRTCVSCDGDHTTTGANGKKQDCAPYKCDRKRSCRDQCTSVAECVAPAVCDTSHQCVLPTADSGGNGCNVAALGGRSSAFLAWAAMMLAGLIRPRRRR